MHKNIDVGYVKGIRY